MERCGSLSKIFLSRGSVQFMSRATPIFLLLTLEFSRDLKRVEKLRKINELLRGFIGRWTSFDFIIFHLLCFSFFLFISLFVFISDNGATESSASNTHGRRFNLFIFILFCVFSYLHLDLSGITFADVLIQRNHFLVILSDYGEKHFTCASP